MVIKDEMLIQNKYKEWKVGVEYEKVNGINCCHYVITSCMWITRRI